MITPILMQCGVDLNPWAFKFDYYILICGHMICFCCFKILSSLLYCMTSFIPFRKEWRFILVYLSLFWINFMYYPMECGKYGALNLPRSRHPLFCSWSRWIIEAMLVCPNDMLRDILCRTLDSFVWH